SVSHPNVYAAGDSAYAIGDNGLPLPMSCASPRCPGPARRVCVPVSVSVSRTRGRIRIRI
ncbi:hypothetical protein, partial [Streptomyces sp. NPDC000410]|uniref:hypothetical protein n=1 Tax=Streptomyces sp. NPDC000410 TaxID=3154254 RepID=UPI00331ABFB3